MDEKKKEKVKTESEEEIKETDQTEKLNKKIEDLTAKADEYKDKWMRSVAEFDNYKKRNAKLWQDAFAEGKADVLLKILPIGDNLDMAIGMGLDEKTTEGLKLLKRKFSETLAALEVEEINPEGEKFDPNFAEAIMQEEGAEGEENRRHCQIRDFTVLLSVHDPYR